MTSKLYQNLVTQTQNKILGIAANFPKEGVSKPAVPMFFLKSPSSLVLQPKQLNISTFQGINHEIELGVCIGKTCKNVSKEQALDYIGGYFLVFDLTSSIIGEYRKSGRSFCLAKGFDGFCPVSEFIPADQIGDCNNVDLQLKINGKIRQAGNTSQLFYKVAEQIEYLSRVMTLNEGDLILTGTPEPVTQISSGDLLEGQLSFKGKVLQELTTRVNFEVINENIHANL